MRVFRVGYGYLIIHFFQVDGSCEVVELQNAFLKSPNPRSRYYLHLLTPESNPQSKEYLIEAVEW